MHKGRVLIQAEGMGEHRWYSPWSITVSLAVSEPGLVLSRRKQSLTGLLARARPTLRPLFLPSTHAQGRVLIQAEEMGEHRW